MSNPFSSFFGEVKNLFTKLFVTEQKVQHVATAVIKDAPEIQATLPSFWGATVKMGAGISAAMTDKGININEDEEAYSDIKAWWPQFKAFSLALEKTYNDSVAAGKVPIVTTQPVIAVPLVAEAKK